ncbi:homoserine O-succinyltransferase [Methylobacterium sp. BE186]|uniref:homoserine O-succinyltransferase MetA n=1 Tax=Methylobacterium sp. BE186 TaxID=2817715 RepID=UPI00285A6CB4|nr:homoserine O-succinyltransferase [Methylobacterium sp. BE186]MDR7035338.1 homoserine O-succinyltransferase [Methylobacterium sp. BE186]
MLEVPQGEGRSDPIARPPEPPGVRAAALPPRLSVGLLNNMPDAALVATERQFRRLIEAAGVPVDLRLFSLAGLERGPQALAHLDAAYAPHTALAHAGLDALVVTGCEPRAARLSDEPYYPAFAGIVDWAATNTVSTLFSCLAAHAAVLHLDGIERRPLNAKHSGLYACAAAARHPLLAGAPRVVPVPHSRWNDLPEPDLARAGYTVLRRSEEVGVDLFVREGASLLVFLQGHPEYDGDSLAREYRRDVGRFLSGERPAAPVLPAHYFAPEAAARLAAFASARGSRFEAYPAIDPAPPLQAAWQAEAVRLFRAWLGEVARRVSRAAEPAPASSAIPSGGPTAPDPRPAPPFPSGTGWG